MVNRILFVLSLSLTLTLVAGWASTLKLMAADPNLHEGTVVSASAGKLVMADSEGKQHSHSMDKDVKITVHGKPGKLEDLQPSMKIRVMTDKDGKALSVSTVDDQKLPAVLQ